MAMDRTSNLFDLGPLAAGRTRAWIRLVLLGSLLIGGCFDDETRVAPDPPPRSPSVTMHYAVISPPDCRARLTNEGNAGAVAVRLVVWDCDSVTTLTPAPDQLWPSQSVDVDLSEFSTAGQRQCRRVVRVEWQGGSQAYIDPRPADVRFSRWESWNDSIAVGWVTNVGGIWADSVRVFTESAAGVAVDTVSSRFGGRVTLYQHEEARFTAKSSTDVYGNPAPPALIKITWLDFCGPRSTLPTGVHTAVQFSLHATQTRGRAH